jgi:hypothetical protein
VARAASGGGVREAPVNAARAPKSAGGAALTAHLAVNADRTLESAARTAFTRALARKRHRNPTLPRCPQLT